MSHRLYLDAGIDGTANTRSGNAKNGHGTNTGGATAIAYASRSRANAQPIRESEQSRRNR